jgi:hypothetical protein
MLCPFWYSTDIRLITVERAQFNFRHRFWSNIIQVGRSPTHGWFFVRKFERNSASSETFRPLLALVRPKLVAKINCVHSNILNEFRPYQNHCVHNNFVFAKMAEIRSKTVDYAQFKFYHQFGRTMPKLVEMFPNWSNFTGSGALKTNHGSNFN